MFYKKLKRIAVFVLSLCVITVAIIIIQRNIKNISYAMLMESIRSTPIQNIVLSLLATGISFVALALHEVVALKAATAHKLLARIPMGVGAIGNAFGNTLGFHAITISVWRYRIYARSGLSVLDIARITGMAAIGLALGFAGTAAFAMVWDSEPLNMAGLAEDRGRRFLGLAIMASMAVMLWMSRKRKQIGFRTFTLLLPDRSILIMQLLIGLIEMSAAVYSCYVLLPANTAPGFAHFTILYIASTLFGIASHAPGGIGVFEAGMMTALTAEGQVGIIAALLLYRLIYNLLPFVIASLGAAFVELRHRSVR